MARKSLLIRFLSGKLRLRMVVAVAVAKSARPGFLSMSDERRLSRLVVIRIGTKDAKYQ